jgi:hypothetical protein
LGLLGSDHLLTVKKPANRRSNLHLCMGYIGSFCSQWI